MPEVTYRQAVAAPLDRVWEFVQDMDNWAPLVMGYQSHEKLSDLESVWSLKGELGGLTRTARFRVLITEWNGPGRVRFELRGLQEPVNGTGTFESAEIVDAVGDTPRGDAAPSAHTASRAEAPSLFARAMRWLLARVFPASAKPRSRPLVAQQAGVPPRPPESTITFSLSLHATGATGPVLNLLLAPMLEPVAQDLASAIAREIEAR